MTVPTTSGNQLRTTLLSRQRLTAILALRTIEVMTICHNPTLRLEVQEIILPATWRASRITPPIMVPNQALQL